MFHYCFGIIGTGHKSGYVYRGQPKHYLLMLFRNDYFIEVDGKMIQGKGGSFVFHAPNKQVAHGPRSKREGFINDWLFFDADDDETEFLKQVPMDRPVSAENADMFTACLSRIINENLRNDPHSCQLISGYIYQMLVEVIRSEQLQWQKQRDPYVRFEGYRRYFREHCQQHWDLGKMAAHAGYSPSHFSAIYKSILGTSPMEDLLSHRLQLAQQLLGLKTYQVGEVAQLCGFSSLHYFSEFFKKRTGRSPSAY